MKIRINVLVVLDSLCMLMGMVIAVSYAKELKNDLKR